MDLIYRPDLKRIICDSCLESYRNEKCHTCSLMDTIDSLPSLDAVINHGYWITHNTDNPLCIYGECSECHEEVNHKFKYCPYCGTKMDKEEKE